MKAVIIEDEPFSARRLKQLLLELRPTWSVVEVLDSVETSINWFRSNAMPDVIIMDVRVADGLSFEIFQEVNITAPIIFITAYDHYALQAFKVNSIDYLLKPVDRDALNKSLAKLEGQDLAHLRPTPLDDKEFRKYSSVTEEDRIFMFIDLNNSTALAERMGHILYSRFLTLCFDLLINVINTYRGEVYQLVGDEVVITWRADRIEDYKNVFCVYYDYEKAIELNSGSFLDQYNAVPKFTASIHKGPVALSYVGNKLKDLAYHGDVLNSAARMLEVAKTQPHKVVVSSDFLQGIQETRPFIVESLGELKGRGKSKSISLFSVKTAGDFEPLLPDTRLKK